MDILENINEVYENSLRNELRETIFRELLERMRCKVEFPLKDSNNDFYKELLEKVEQLREDGLWFYSYHEHVIMYIEYEDDFENEYMEMEHREDLYSSQMKISDYISAIMWDVTVNISEEWYRLLTRDVEIK